MTTEWHWEGNVVKIVASHFEKEGWIIEKTADTETREAGVDIRARKGNVLLLIEVKGYPSKLYQRGENKGKQKRTNPSTQARHWYSEVLFSAILRQAENPNAVIAIALPGFTVFTNLVRRTQGALDKLGIKAATAKVTYKGQNQLKNRPIFGGRSVLFQCLYVSFAATE